MKQSKIKLKIPDIITFASLCFGILSIVFSIKKNYTLAAVLLVFSVVFDYFDGKVARIMKNSNQFGEELDSLVDIVSFGVAPVVFTITQVNNTSSFNFALIASLVFICCGAFRLAKYNSTKFNGTYQGIPITSNGIIIPLCYLFNLHLNYYPHLLIILALLMVGPFKIKKIS